MNRNDYGRRMDEAVADRLKSDSWDLRIAGAVNAKKRTRTRRFLLSSASSLALAASVVLVLTFEFRTHSERVYEPFIARQLADTHAAVFQASDEGTGTGAKSGEIVFDSGVDSVIDNALALR